jgi:predicted component of type VI protein secretion system
MLTATIILASVAVIAAVIAAKAATYTKRGVKAQAICEILREYSDVKMRDDIRLLEYFVKDDGCVTRFKSAIWDYKEYDEYNPQDAARRHIAHHFNKIYVLNNRHVLDEDDVKMLAREEQVEVLLGFVEKLEKDESDRSMYDYFRKLYKVK